LRGIGGASGIGPARARHCLEIFSPAIAGLGGRQLWLAGHGATLLVVGAARDVYPSGMMPDGRIAYRIHPGRRAERADVVDIFAPAEQGVIATVAEQKENFEAWIRSLAA